MTPEAARDKKIGGQDADFEGKYLLRNSPKVQKEGVIQLGSLLQNVHL